MNRLLNIAGIFFASFFLSVYAQKPDSISVKHPQASTSYVKEMTCRTFIKEVYDYRRKSTPWLFKGSKPAIIVLYADWCAPCRQMGPIVNDMALEYIHSVKFYKVNIDTERDIMDYFKASYIPYFIFIPINEEPQRFKGTMDKDTFKKRIEEILFKNNSFD